MLFLKERAGKLISDIKALIYTDIIPVEEYRFIKSRERYTDIAGICTENWELLRKQELWGGHREYFWFETFITIPQCMDGKCVIYELKTGKEGEWDATNPQFTIYVNNQRRQGLDVNHREVLLCEQAKAGEVYRIVLSAFTGDHNLRLQMDSCIKVLHRKTEHYYYDLAVPYETARLLEPSDRNFRTIILALNESLNLLDLRIPYSEAYETSLEAAQEYITKEFYDRYGGGSQETVYCVGHTHIDVAWMWTLAVTEDKAVRSFSTVLELMEQYPEYIFMSSQPQLYKYVKKNAPDVYAKIKERVKEGRWEVEGGMFLEADCNIPSGESLVRQFMYGKTFFREEFNKDNEILWLPDVFGYSAALPQIMEKCGIRYFMTTKISWNEINKMPYDTFEWEGIDGTRILTHFSPSRDYKKAAVEGGTETEHFTTYNAYINPSQVKGGFERYSQKYLNDEVLMSFGYGDGGGGPVKDMLENQRRLAKGIPGCPKTVMSTAGHFFHVLEKSVKEKKYLPVWVGELYLEYHRGTYTSMARNKRYNRKSEFLLENTELFSEMASLLTGAAYPEKELQELWEILLRNQFHDILPGSAIEEVYEDSKREYESLLERGEILERAALRRLTEQVSAQKGALVIFNPNGMTNSGIAVFEAFGDGKTPVVYDGGKICPVQKCEDGTWMFLAEDIPAKGYRTFEVSEAPDQMTGSVMLENAEQAGDSDGRTQMDGTALQVSVDRLENRYVRILFAENGEIASVYDKLEKREVLKPGKNANVLMTYEDRPHNWDAWDINNYYTEKSWEITDLGDIQVTEAGPVRATVKVTRSYLNSEIVQYISLRADSPEIQIRNEIDWREHEILLKALIPVDIHTDEAAFEIQYGNVTRKTHRNTSWDVARFEVCMHKWMDVSENGYGVSILNDCKYGASVNDGVIGISLLKSALYPNPAADKEHHSFTYSIYPHKGGFREAGTIRKAYELNNPLLVCRKEKEGGSLAPVMQLVHAEEENIVIEVVKQAEKSEATILRLYETFNRRGSAHLHFARPVKALYECNMLEEDERELVAEGTKAQISVKPYEIKTLKVIW